MSNFEIGNLIGSQNYSDFVDSNDPNDIYNFSVGKTGAFSLSLNGLTANADVQLLNKNGNILYTSKANGKNPEAINVNDLVAGDYTVRVFQVSGKTNYNLSLTYSETNSSTDPITGLGIKSGYFTVGQSGEVTFDFVNDDSTYQSELAIFSLSGMDKFVPGSPEFIKEAARRALSNSVLGYTVISDPTEGAKYNVSSDKKNYNDGQYLGLKKFAMNPGDTFGLMLVPDGKVQEVFNKPHIVGKKRALFSLEIAQPTKKFHQAAIADVDGTGTAFAIEDRELDFWTDRDYNDLIFKVTGATGKAVGLDGAIDPKKDWRTTVAGKELLDYLKGNSPVNPTPVNPTPVDPTPIDPIVEDPTPEDPIAEDSTPQIDQNQPLIGVIDTGFNGNNPDLDYRRFLLGSDRISQDNNPLLSPVEKSEHGTHILGLIAATQGNEIGIDGINDKAPIWLGRAVGSGTWASSLIEFVDAAKQSGQKNAVVNLSLDLTQINPDGSVTTRYELTPKEREAIEYARQNHVLIVTAAGNDGGVMSVLGQASQEFDNIITVGASDGIDRANYSSYGAGLDILTEGGSLDNPVLSTVGNSVGKMAGTSVAAAKATGVASLVWAVNPDLNYRQVIDILNSTATDLKTQGWDSETGSGLLNSAAAVELAKKTVGQVYTPEPWVAPFTWDGEGKVTPTERATEGGISIATATQVTPFFSDNDKVDLTTPEKYYQFTVNQPGYVRWTLTRTNGSNEFPGATLVKADSTPGSFKFVPGGAMLSGSVDGQTTPISITNGVFVDPGTYYLRLRNGITNTVKNYNLSNQFIPDSVNAFQTPVNYSTTPYFDFSPDIQTKAFNGSSATGLNVSGQVEFKFGDLSKRTAKYGLEVKETGKLNFNVLSPNGMVEVRVEKFIGNEDKTENLAYYEFAANANYSNEITLNKGRYQIEIKANGDEVIPGQILQLPYTLTGVFSRLAPKVGEGNVPIGAGNFIKTVTSNGVDTHYYTNGHLSVQPKGTSTWYTSGTGDTIPLLGGTITPIEDTVKKYSFEYYYGNGTFLNGQYAGGGDYYKGYFYANDGFYFKDQRIAQTTFNSSGNKGFYKITDASLSGSSSDVGDVYITSYSDNDTSKGVFKTLNFDEALSNQGLGTEYGYIGSKFFDKDTELDLSDPDGNTSMSTSEYLQLNQATSGKSIGGGFDRADYYRFSLNQINDVSILLSGLTASSGFSVIQDLNNNGQFEPNESLGVSSGTATTQWIRTTFAAGNYYVRVFPDNPNDLNGKTNYNLKVSATPELPGNTFGQAYNVGLLNNYYGNPKSFTGALRTNHDTEDYYRFQLDRRSNVSLTLDGLITTRLGSAMVEGATPNTLLQLIRDTNNNGQIDAGEMRGSVFANPTQTGSINKSLEAGNYFVRVTPEGSNPVNTAYAITMSAQSRTIPTTRWNARFINRNPDNVADFNSYDFSNPTAVLDLGSQSSGDGKIRLYKDFGLNSPAFNVQSDNFAMEASTITRLEAGKLYKVTTKSDDGTQFFLTKVGSATTRKNLEQLGGWSNGDWRDRGADKPAKTIYLKVPESGDYVFDVQYYEKGIGSKIDVTLEENKSFVENTNGSEWYAGFYWWDKNQSEPPLKLYENPENEIGIVNLGSNVRDDGKNGIKFDWRDGIPKNDSRLPGDLFAIRAYTQADFEAGKEYRAFVKGDDGFQLFAKKAYTDKWYYFTDENKWEQNYGDLKEVRFKVPETGLYDLHFQFYEKYGDTNFDFYWEEVPPPQKPDIKIELVDHYNQFSPSQWAKIQQAAANWERIITKDKDSSGILRISVNKGQTDNPVWLADTIEDNAVNYRTNFSDPSVDLDGVDYHNNIRFNSNRLSYTENNNLFVRVAMHEIGNALGLPDDNSSLNLMNHDKLNPLITETMYKRLEELGYSVDRNAFVDWNESNNPGGGNPGGGNPGGGSNQPTISIPVNFNSPVYTTDNKFWLAGYGGPNCTWYANGRLKELGYQASVLDGMLGNAYQWDNLAPGAGATVSNQAQVGAITVWEPYHGGAGNLGHVAVVEQVNSDGSILISESNWLGQMYHTRTIYPNSAQWPDHFIVVPKVGGTTNPGSGNPGGGNSGGGNPGNGNPGGGNPDVGNPGGGNPGHGNPAPTPKDEFFSIGTLGELWDAGNRVSSTNRNDYYSFNIDKRSNLRADFNAIDTHARLSILGVPKQIDTSSGSASWILEPGNYQIKIEDTSGDTDYNFSLHRVNLVENVTEKGLTKGSKWNLLTQRFDSFDNDLPDRSGKVNLYHYNSSGRTSDPDQGIEPGKDTIVVIHGRGDSSAGTNIKNLLTTAASKYGSQYQILALDWQELATDNGQPPFTAARAITPVAEWAVNTLKKLGIAADKISLFGHSLGSYVSSEIGRLFGKVENLVAIDPAFPGHSYDIDGNTWDVDNTGDERRITEFKYTANHSLAFVVRDGGIDGIAGDGHTADKADNSLVISYDNWPWPNLSDAISPHNRAVDVVADALSKGYLKLENNVALPSDLLKDKYGDDGRHIQWTGTHEGRVTATRDGKIKELAYINGYSWWEGDRETKT
ncbi:hypothetical protein NIES2119_25930 [[Phormidium ambiguum] IAM M-71]|uniref:Peptidase C51 domain-containing protein n=1 Tax=[Phormidium ambiguum] IAM M-71 TaxID=454136 RepID=A0A1U7I870_9CYAN|nr:S8 family serine peptidase [Phormidium ambiguum]OKH32577.1 hypothetical protein NIES2119_25930 [Phormidium ambiguum IAM M-71]